MSKEKIKIELLYYINEQNQKVYDFEEMTNLFENELSKLNKNIVVMCSITEVEQ